MVFLDNQMENSRDDPKTMVELESIRAQTRDERRRQAEERRRQQDLKEFLRQRGKTYVTTSNFFNCEVKMSYLSMIRYYSFLYFFLKYL